MRLRAVLAGGLVLGIGTTATLAAWNDSEYATTTVTAGQFGIQGSVDNATYADHGSAAPVALTPAMPVLGPGGVGYQGMYLRAIAGSVTGGTLASYGISLLADYNPVAEDDFRQALSYQIRATTTMLTGTCDTVFTAALSATVVQVAGASTPVVGPSTVTAATALGFPASTATVAGAPIRVCVQWTLASTAPTGVQNDAFTVQWQFTGSVGT